MFSKIWNWFKNAPFSSPSQKIIIVPDKPIKPVTIVIQGMGNWTSYANIPNYLKVANVIVCCYEGQATYLEEMYPEIKVIRTQPPEYHAYNRHNLFLQGWTSHVGLMAVESEFAIKVRSDESYGDLSKFISMMVANPDCLTTNNIFFCKSELEPFCVSDHLMGGRTTLMQACFAELIQLCKDYGAHSPPMEGTHMGLSGHRHELPNESIICLCFLKGKGVSWGSLGERHNLTVISNLMKQHTRCVPMEDLYPYIWSYGTKTHRMYMTTFSMEHTISRIEDV